MNGRETLPVSVTGEVLGNAFLVITLLHPETGETHDELHDEDLLELREEVEALPRGGVLRLPTFDREVLRAFYGQVFGTFFMLHPPGSSEDGWHPVQVMVMLTGGRMSPDSLGPGERPWEGVGERLVILAPSPGAVA